MQPSQQQRRRRVGEDLESEEAGRGKVRYSFFCYLVTALCWKDSVAVLLIPKARSCEIDASEIPQLLSLVGQRLLILPASGGIKS